MEEYTQRRQRSYRSPSPKLKRRRCSPSPEGRHRRGRFSDCKMSSSKSPERKRDNYRTGQSRSPHSPERFDARRPRLQTSSKYSKSKPRSPASEHVEPYRRLEEDAKRSGYQPDKIPPATHHAFSSRRENQRKPTCHEPTTTTYQPGKVPPGARKNCFNCGREGHWKPECPQPIYGSGYKKDFACHACGQSGHRKAECTRGGQYIASKGSLMNRAHGRRRYDDSQEEKNRIFRPEDSRYQRPSDTGDQHQDVQNNRSHKQLTQANSGKGDNLTQTHSSQRGEVNREQSSNPMNEMRATIKAMMNTIGETSSVNGRIDSKVEQSNNTIDGNFTREKVESTLLDENCNFTRHSMISELQTKDSVETVHPIVYDTIVDATLDKLFPLCDIVNAKLETIIPKTTTAALVESKHSDQNLYAPRLNTTSSEANNETTGLRESSNPYMSNSSEDERSRLTSKESHGSFGKGNVADMTTSTNERLMPQSKVVRMTPPASPNESRDNFSGRLNLAVTNPRDPRNRAHRLGLGTSNRENCNGDITNIQPQQRIKELLKQGVPEPTFNEKDGFDKMWLTFSGRIQAVKQKPLEQCEQIADKMIECCQKTFNEYVVLADRYLLARTDHMVRSSKAENNSCKDEMSKVPPLLELRHALHKDLYETMGKTAKLPFKFSELVDLSMYYFNYVASSDYWRKA